MLSRIWAAEFRSAKDLLGAYLVMIPELIPTLYDDGLRAAHLGADAPFFDALIEAALSEEQGANQAGTIMSMSHRVDQRERLPNRRAQEVRAVEHGTPDSRFPDGRRAAALISTNRLGTCVDDVLRDSAIREEAR
jgi:hypothetical protein